MISEETPAKKTRKKRRVPGTDTPPRVSLMLRMEQQDFDQMAVILKNAKVSRNDFICSLIAQELAHLERFRALNTDPTAPHYVPRGSDRRAKPDRRNLEN